MTTSDREEAIRQRAHRIWEDEGRPEGAEARHWDEARRQIEAEPAPTPSEPAPEEITPAAEPAPAAKKPRKSPVRKTAASSAPDDASAPAPKPRRAPAKPRTPKAAPEK